jgi:hypothetical protein
MELSQNLLWGWEVDKIGLRVCREDRWIKLAQVCVMVMMGAWNWLKMFLAWR